MEARNSTKQGWAFIVVIFLVIYISFPTSNSGIDAWGYAAQVKYQSGLFNSHHLLYNITNFFLLRISGALGISPDVLMFMKAMNALAATACLAVLYFILSLLRRNQTLIISYLAIAGASFTFMRFATENETYIFPIFFSLLASYFYIKYWKRKPTIVNTLACGMFSAIAALYHQIHFFWWLAFFLAGAFCFFKGEKKFILPFFLPALLVPLAYMVVLLFTTGSLTSGKFWVFVFHDFHTGTASIGIDAWNFVLSGINLVRSFYQVHGYMGELFNHQPLFILPALLSVVLIGRTLFFLVREWKEVSMQDHFLFISFLGVFLLQFLMAFLSRGNAEFMVMLPLVLVIMLASLKNIPQKAMASWAVSLLIWNFFLGVYPLNRYNFDANYNIAQVVQVNPSVEFILKDKVLVDNIIYYNSRLFVENTWLSPAEYLQRMKTTAPLDSLINTTDRVFTDCASNPVLMNRAAILQQNHNEEFFGKYDLSPIDSFPVYAGFYSLYRVKLD